MLEKKQSENESETLNESFEKLQVPIKKASDIKVKRASDIKAAEKSVVIKLREDAFRLAKQAADVFRDSDVSIGSWFDSTTNSPVRPLSFLEEREIMPRVINISHSSPDFERKVEEYFQSLTIKVPPKIGKTLNISCTTKQIDYEGEYYEIDVPHSPVDYVAYRFVTICHRVAKNKEEAVDAPSGVVFYIEDKEATLNSRKKQREIEATAQTAWLRISGTNEKIKANEEKISHIFELTKDIHETDGKGLKIDDKVLIINDTVILKEPQIFTDIVDDTNLSLKATVLKALETQILNKIGNKIFDIDEELGEGLDEVCIYINNPKNADYLPKLKARIEQKIKNK